MPNSEIIMSGKYRRKKKRKRRTRIPDILFDIRDETENASYASDSRGRLSESSLDVLSSRCELCLPSLLLLLFCRIDKLFAYLPKGVIDVALGF